MWFGPTSFWSSALKPSSLQRVFLIPFVLLMICLAITIAWVLYRAGKDATDAMLQKALADVMSQVRQGAEQHLARAHATLQAVAPEPTIARQTGRAAAFPAFPFPDDLKKLEERLWIAAGLHAGINSYVYFGGADGRFIGVNRDRKEDYELRLRQSSREFRSVYSMAGPSKPLGLLATDSYDPRMRPWYERAVARGAAAWSPMYTDFIKRMPLLTLAKPVYRPDRSLVGVVSTDLPLTELARFLQSLSISENGVAFIVDGNASLIATSAKELPYQLNEESLGRLSPAQSSVLLIRQAYQALSQRSAGSAELMSYTYDSTFGTAQSLAVSLKDEAGLDWTLVVAVPRSDFHGSVTGSIYQSLSLGLIAVIVALMLGFAILHRALADIRKLTLAARSVGTGEPFRSLDIDRGDEIGELAQSLQQMEHNLRTDKLTHLLNRDSFIAQIDFRCRNASATNPLRFSVLFIDLDNFKMINDCYGHDEGDHVLVEVARRLQRAIRKDDSAARFGGDEFVVYLHGVDDGSTVDAIREKIRDVLQQPVAGSAGEHSYLGASIGAACYPADGQDSSMLFKIADMRMFQSKKERKTQRALGLE